MNRSPYLGSGTSPSGPGGRGQTALPSLVIALVVLTAATAVGLSTADRALSAAERDAPERRAAVSIAERLVATGSPVADRANVLNRTRLDTLTVDRLERSVPLVETYDVRLRVNGSTVLGTGPVTGGTTVRRVVVLADHQRRTIRPDLGLDRTVTLPRRTDRVTLVLSPPENTTITAVRANERVLLRNPDGLEGRFVLGPSRYETTRFRFVGTGPLRAGNVTLRYPAPRTTKATLGVTVDG